MTSTATIPFAPLTTAELTRRERVEAKADAEAFQRNPLTIPASPYGDALRARLNLPR